ncbi:hypothetical protein B0A58_14610 [Flavobacterium branchiophilum NBRC 15030 = ATCC 35035]|uniref:Uncharacterized protein DUF3822 n=2 Tax=Flavobacterium branchiophilum TaxID=55197 RepID=A0A543G043_9FLAO|nr:DUF3822 family protein [Flavobacterium branchiophilum]OXA70385.1 hypothetical protein B0A58_14610 [Flavobacterium branchiophilum NBRC 15030 = ATCC 35035]TQM39452.1 uncharacterized protein DUF3822 [Flavobacterium branchiophilum]GEM55930.1 hypothetical protein FB1_21510 [Flavobacterium branchiophilum NBRC 15030 = ATCC 35035]
MNQNKTIIEKNDQKLIVQVGLDGVTFCAKNALTQSVVWVKELDFKLDKTENNVRHLFEQLFEKFPELHQKYEDIVVLHNNNLSAFVPKSLFDENHIADYIKFNTKVYETDAFNFDPIENHDLTLIYIPFIHFNNGFIDYFGSFDYKHAHAILVTRLLEISKNNLTKKMFVHKQKGLFEIIVIQNQKLLLFNTFEYRTPEDFIYYILFTAEQLQMNPELFCLELLGDITTDDVYFKIVYQYVRNVNLLDINLLQEENIFSIHENLKHFILFYA